MKTLTLLQPGMIVKFDFRPHVVLMVNDCRALIQRTQKRRRIMTPKTGKNAFKQVVFFEPVKPVSISPNSELEILQEAKP